jgi:quercetin dioxygenase-like cupin family protein
MDLTFKPIEEAVTFQEANATKIDLVRGHHLFVGLNCFEAGQSQPVHHHSGTDKFYLVVSGKARMIVGDQDAIAEAGTLVWAPADVPHGVLEALERTIMLVGMAPPPGA